MLRIYNPNIHKKSSWLLIKKCFLSRHSICLSPKKGRKLMGKRPRNQKIERAYFSTSFVVKT
nr:hypothetical protein [uncultured bacterium]